NPRDPNPKVTQPMFTVRPTPDSAPPKPSLVEVQGGFASAPEVVRERAIQPIGAPALTNGTWERTPAAAIAPVMATPRPLPPPADRALKVSVRSPLFRAQALAAHQRGEPLSSVLRITSVSRWAWLAALGLTLLMAYGWTAIGRVEETSRARGVLRAPFGVQPVVSLVAGTLREVVVRGDAHVEAGDLIARLDATPLQSELEAAEQHLASVDTEWSRTRAALTARQQRRVRLTEQRMNVLAQRQQRQGGKIARRQQLARKLAAPELQAVVEDQVRDQSVDALEGARDEQLQLSDQLSSLQLGLVAAQSEYEARLEEGDARARAALQRRNAAHMMLAQTELRAPRSGKLESLRAQPGQVVQQGEWIARVVAEELPHTIVAFAPERDLAFLRRGATARVEIDQLPIVEFGLAHATVTRVGGELAEDGELKAALGEAAPHGPHVAVELALATQPARVAALLRPGTLVTARIALRERRLLAIVFEPLRRWFL
ncbi:MAG TPA: HlyD family efflux transporter periplasmic adaptor subunit, partial [Polyangiales bacterium]|nr:HlyD family efflux transporter periplasmic adaptor subunit [Polyangiales bacterium]